ncbi:YfhO family protein [Vagococcus xieshaowenii]|uniref:Copper ABC transporter permease n=1 Tax=Vagococcus xieshaowenii TaxID=2562451 RepID=A0AAJ5JQV4_9ENTE|nr:YfhO family protein [Vagococcus xieshaowenii]QCA28437.1 copper ABC transporter permease [Vagococcus xieshaowenii]TFZ42807.1 copper ABC transporter permease [Vagococcus xieshaowenii]
MASTFKTIIKTEKKYWLSAFLIPMIILALAYLTVPIYPGSKLTLLASDAFSQFSNFHANFRNMLLGKQSIFYSWNASLGLNYLSLISYYLGGIFTPLVLLFPLKMIPDAMYVLTLLKFGCAGLSFWIFARQTYRIKPLYHVLLAISYALMGFAVAHSELIMWLDTFVWIPLILLGIHRVIEQKKPILLFVSYLLLFMSNFYFGFMVGVFSFLYFFIRVSIDWRHNKQAILPYFITSILAGLSSMIIILPTIFDLRENGEALTEIKHLKTAATSWLDIPAKNMIGSFDTTKYGSIPFIYIGLIPLFLCTFYFVSKKFSAKHKILFAGLFTVIIASFYIEPLNLFWHGFHAPNMFLFRYSFLFSVLVIVLAGYALEKLTKDDLFTLQMILMGWLLIFGITYCLPDKFKYDFLTNWNFLLTLIMISVYLILLIVYSKANSFNWLRFNYQKTLTLLLCAFLALEVTTNTTLLITSIRNDWNYPSRSLLNKTYDEFQDVVDQAKKRSNDEFFRMEAISPISSNDSFKFNYNGVSMFNSIRNRHSSSLLHKLGFRSRGTNLNIRYANNTLIMDSLLGIKYNQTANELTKFGFNEVFNNKEYQLYQNDYAAGLGILTNKALYDITIPENDNLTAQTNLLNQLAGTNERFFTSTKPEIVTSTNTTIHYNESNHMTLTEQQGNIGKKITWKVAIPAGKQAYMSIFPTNFGELSSSTAELTINGRKTKTQLSVNGQYYDLGYYNADTTLEFSVEFYGTRELTIMNPPVILLDIPAYQLAMTQVNDQSVNMDVNGRHVIATANVVDENKNILFTTIPFDKGWQAKVNGKTVEIKDFEDGFITLPLAMGENTIEMTYLPQGFLIGVGLFISCSILFAGYVYYLKKKEQTYE